MNECFQSEEKWAPIQFRGLKNGEQYQISSLGNLRYLNQETQNWTILKTTNSAKDGSGYIYFSWFKSSRGWKHKIIKPIHRLVAEAFCSRESILHKFVIHLDYNKINNDFRNLRWVSQKELTTHNQLNPNVIRARKIKKDKTTNLKAIESEMKQLKLKSPEKKKILQKLANKFGFRLQ
ncbi:MAG: HNH endonuclease [Bacteroidales bacterium]|nr:HNH endonuclease [Bacteroidales bacterium]